MAEFIEMLEAFTEEEKRQSDADYYLAAWMAAHIMNSSGNYKKAITPNTLLGKSDKPQQKKMTLEERKQAIQELKKKFDKA